MEKAQSTGSCLEMKKWNKFKLKELCSFPLFSIPLSIPPLIDSLPRLVWSITFGWKRLLFIFAIISASNCF